MRSSAAAAVIAALISTSVSIADEWPQWRGPQRDGVWRETGIVQSFAGDQLKLKWRAPIAAGYSGPTVAEGMVLITDRLTEPKQIERVHAFDRETGKPIWTHSYDCPYVGVGYGAGPRACVSIDEGRAFALGAMGHLFALSVGQGEVLWSHDLNSEYKIRMPIWGISASPLVDGQLVIVQIGGENGACLVAFDKQTGKETWRALDDRASYSAPIIIEQGGKRVLVCWTGDHVVGLDPQTGKSYWAHGFQPTKMVINIATPVVENDRMFLTSFYDGALMLAVDRNQPAVDRIWKRIGKDERRTDALHSIISTPYLEGDYIYGVDSYGELRCLDAKTGDRLWENLTATPKARWSTIHFVRNGKRMFLFNERGELIIARLSPDGYHEISRAKLIEPTTEQLGQRGGVCWSHPAFAHKCVFQRNDEAIVCADLSEGSN